MREALQTNGSLNQTEVRRCFPLSDMFTRVQIYCQTLDYTVAMLSYNKINYLIQITKTRAGTIINGSVQRTR